MGMITGTSFDHAMKRIDMGGESAPIPAAYRRLARLIQNGDLQEALRDTLALRGLERCVAINDHSEKSDDVRLAFLDRAGWRKEKRGDTEVRILDL